VKRVDAHEHAEHARHELGLSLGDLWLAYLGVGGSATLPQLDAYLTGGTGFNGAQHDYVAQALNDCFVGRGGNHPVPYAETFRGVV
jgi:hypothetical protein